MEWWCPRGSHRCSLYILFEIPKNVSALFILSEIPKNVYSLKKNSVFGREGVPRERVMDTSAESAQRDRGAGAAGRGWGTGASSSDGGSVKTFGSSSRRTSAPCFLKRFPFRTYAMVFSRQSDIQQQTKDNRRWKQCCAVRRVKTGVFRETRI